MSVTVPPPTYAYRPEPVPLPHPAAPDGWTPEHVVAVPSSLRTGLLGGALDIRKGVTEAREGQALSSVQVDTLTPFLAGAYQLPEPRVREALDGVRIYLGGPAGKMHNNAMTIGQHIYVGHEEDLHNLLDYDDRRWLAQDLGHTMQWLRQDDGPLTPEANHARDRKFTTRYALTEAASVPKALVSWVRGHDYGRFPLGDEIHSASPIEVEANEHAVAFEQATLDRVL